MPTRVLEPFIAHRAGIEAQRALDEAERVAVGTGRMRPDDHRATVARWQRDITGGQAAARPRDPAELAAAARAAGIGIRTVRRAPAP